MEKQCQEYGCADTPNQNLQATPKHQRASSQHSFMLKFRDFHAQEIIRRINICLSASAKEPQWSYAGSDPGHGKG